MFSNALEGFKASIPDKKAQEAFEKVYTRQISHSFHRLKHALTLLNENQQNEFEKGIWLSRVYIFYFTQKLREQGYTISFIYEIIKTMDTDAPLAKSYQDFFTKDLASFIASFEKHKENTAFLRVAKKELIQFGHEKAGSIVRPKNLIESLKNFDEKNRVMLENEIFTFVMVNQLLKNIEKAFLNYKNSGRCALPFLKPKHAGYLNKELYPKIKTIKDMQCSAEEKYDLLMEQLNLAVVYLTKRKSRRLLGSINTIIHPLPKEKSFISNLAQTAGH